MSLLLLLHSADAGSVVAPREVGFFGPLDEAARLRIRRFGAPGHVVLIRAGLGHAAPVDPDDPAWAAVMVVPEGGGEVIDVDVPLPANDDDYTAAVFSTALDAHSTAVIAVLFGVAAPEPGPVASGWASAVIRTARPGFPHLQVAGGADFAAPLVYDAALDGPAGWRLVADVDEIASPSAGVALPSDGWPAGSGGLYIRRALPTTFVERHHRFAHRVVAT